MTGAPPPPGRPPPSSLGHLRPWAQEAHRAGMSDESLSGSGAGAGGEGRALRPQDSVSGQRRTSKGRREGSGGGPWPVPGRHTPWSLSQHPDRGRWNLGSWCGPASGPDTGWLTRGLCSSWALQLVNVGHAGPIPRPRKRALYPPNRAVPEAPPQSPGWATPLVTGTSP